MVEFNVDRPLAFTAITSPAPGAVIDSDLNLTVTWTLTALPSCTDMNDPPVMCAAGIALFVSPTLGMDEDVFEDVAIGVTETSRDIPNAVLQPNTQYRIEVETFEGTQDEAMTTDGLGDSYLLSRFYEDINSVVVPEPSSRASRAAALGILGVVAWSRRRR